MIKAVKQDIKNFKKEIVRKETSKILKRICGGLMILIAVYWIYVSWF